MHFSILFVWEFVDLCLRVHLHLRLSYASVRSRGRSRAEVVRPMTQPMCLFRSLVMHIKVVEPGMGKRPVAVAEARQAYRDRR